jgi:acyl dehydratase
VLYFEDFPPGDVRESPARTVTREEILAFARQFDPQPFHTDDERARASIYGGLIASGWHTVAIYMRLMWETFLKDTASLGSPGVDEVRWLKPVRPGDTLRARFTVIEAVPSRSKPDRGMVRSLSEVFNQRGELVMTLRGMGLFARRGPRRPPPMPPPDQNSLRRQSQRSNGVDSDASRPG